MPKIKPARIRARGNKDRTWRPLPGFGDGVYPVVKTDEMIQPVGRDEKGRLFTAPTGGGGGSGGIIAETDPTVPAWAKQQNPPTYTAADVGALPADTPIPAKTSDLTNDSGYITIAVATLLNYYLKTETYAKNETYSQTEVDNLISGLDKRLNAIADSEDVDLDQLSEIVAYIKANKSLIDSITTSKVNVSDIVDNLTTADSKKPLSAAQGKALKAMYDALPTWAKAASKPTYTKSEIGLGNVDNVRQYSASNPPPYPVTSVNGKTGAVSLSASDVGARPDTWTPTASDVGALPSGTKIPAVDSTLKVSGAAADAAVVGGKFTEVSEAIADLQGYEPNDGDMPKVFLSGDEFFDMTKDKNEVNMEMDYVSKTDSFHAYIAIKYQGSTSLNFAKKNFTVKLFDDEAHANKQKHLFRDWKYAKHKFVLKANWIDHTHARNIISANLWNEVVASRSDYDSLPEELRNSPKNGAVDGFPIKLYVNGVYQGVYTWNIGKDDWQWGMDEDNTNHALLCVTHNTNGVFKDRAYNFRALWSGVDNEAFEIEVGTNSDALKNGVNAMLGCIIDNNGSAFKTKIEQYLDVQSAIDYYIHQYIICGLDGLAKNILLGTYDLSMWYLGAYDMDATFGLWYDGTKLVSTNYKCPEDYQEKFNLLFERLEENYWSEIQSRYAELRKSVYSFANMCSRFERFTDVIGTELFAEDLEVFPGIPLGSTNNIKQLRNYIRDRLAYCDEQILNGIPGTAVSLDVSSVTINTTVSNTATLVATKTPSNTTDDVYWWSDNTAVASVGNGVVTAVSDGSCTIYAKCGSGYASCAVAVTSVVVPSYTNRVPTSIDADGNIYNGTGYKNQYRLSSSGVEKEADYNTAFGYISAKGGDTIRFKVKGKDGNDVIWADGTSSGNYICVYKSDFSFLYAGNAESGYNTATFVESMTNDGVISTIKLKDNANIGYIRMSVFDDYSSQGVDGTTAVITVNEEITD